MPIGQHCLTSKSDTGDTELVHALCGLAQDAARLMAMLLAYLAELDTRKSYLGLGFSSLFAFATTRLLATRLVEDAIARARRRASAVNHAIRDFIGPERPIPGPLLRTIQCQRHQPYSAEGLAIERHCILVRLGFFGGCDFVDGFVGGFGCVEVFARFGFLGPFGLGVGSAAAVTRMSSQSCS